METLRKGGIVALIAVGALLEAWHLSLFLSAILSIKFDEGFATLLMLENVLLAVLLFMMAWTIAMVIHSLLLALDEQTPEVFREMPSVVDLLAMLVDEGRRWFRWATLLSLVATADAHLLHTLVQPINMTRCPPRHERPPNVTIRRGCIPVEPPTVLLFLHIGKCGGTTVREIFHKPASCGADEAAWEA